MSTEKIALIIYGDGGELGSFKIFADNLQRELEPKFDKTIVKYINRDRDFVNYLLDIPGTQTIAELHIFSHAIGAGLFLGYKDRSIAAIRQNAWQRAFRVGRNIKYSEAVQAEIGAIQTDDFFTPIFTSNQVDIRAKFEASATIKVWGCNSGVANWVYNDDGVVDAADRSAPYYWRAFNEINIPKPSIAAALAKYFNKTVYGAKSGASIEVKHKTSWISTKDYKSVVGQWPSGSLPHRLVPDTGTYYAFKP